MDFSQNLFTKACFILLVLDLVIGPPIPCKGSLDGLVAHVSWSVMNQLVDWTKRSQYTGLIFKADFKKTYDSVSWPFLEYILIRLGFSKRCISWVKAYTCSSSISGVRHKNFIHREA